MTIEALYAIYLAHPSVQTDTRKLKKGHLFFALKGPRYNGNQFAQQAIDAGAAYVVVDEPTESVDPARQLIVPDVLLYLQKLAKHHREQLNIPFLAITGSNGKTTTKELVNAVLSTTYTTYTTEGNLNNHIGVPLTLLSVKSDAGMAVIEMGANHLKEIESYCTYTMPTHGLITNCGKAHLEGFGSEEGVRKGKGELFEYLRAHKGTAFIMNDYAYLREMSAGIPHVITYGSQEAHITGRAAATASFLAVDIEKGLPVGQISTNLVGDYNLPNVLAAVAVGVHFNVSAENIQKALAGYQPSNSRSQLIERGTNKIILDAYNANPTSLRAAIENIAGMAGDNKVLMLGGMMELGTQSIEEHQAIADLLLKYQWKQVALVGGDFAKVKHSFLYFEHATEAGEWLKLQHFKDALLLIKGSRSMQMEKVIKSLD